MRTVHILTGLPASGKSTFARSVVEESQGGVRRVNLDDIRTMLDTGTNGRCNWSGKLEGTALSIQDAAIRHALDDDFDVIVDNTHLTPRIPRRLKGVVRGDAVFKVHSFLDVPHEECVRRDAERTGPAHVGEEVILKLLDRHTKAKKSGWRLTDEWMNDRPAIEPYVPDLNLPGAILCDIDGTLALMNGRNPYNWNAVYEDDVNWAVYRTLSALHETYDDRIILLSGRDGCAYDETKRWLKDNDLIHHELHMRAPGDTRSDDIVKAELFDEHVRHRFNVRTVFDDRDKVVALWRRIGLPCWQVNYGNF